MACRILCSVSPSPFPLDFGFWIWDLDLGLGFGTGLGLDNTFISKLHKGDKGGRHSSFASSE